MHNLKWAANRDFRWMKTAAWKTWQVCSFGKRILLRFDLKESREGFCQERKGKVIPCRMTKDKKGTGINSRESGTTNMEAESIKSRAESTGGCVKLKTVTEIRWSSAHETL